MRAVERSRSGESQLKCHFFISSKIQKSYGLRKSCQKLQWGQRFLGSALRLVDTFIITWISIEIRFFWQNSVQKSSRKFVFLTSYWECLIYDTNKWFPEKKVMRPSGSAESKCRNDFTVIFGAPPGLYKVFFDFLRKPMGILDGYPGILSISGQWFVSNIDFLVNPCYKESVN